MGSHRGNPRLRSVTQAKKKYQYCSSRPAVGLLTRSYMAVSLLYPHTGNGNKGSPAIYATIVAEVPVTADHRGGCEV